MYNGGKERDIDVKNAKIKQGIQYTYIHIFMYLSACLIIAYIASASAKPIPQDGPAKTHIYLCTDESFKGQCENVEAEPGKCYNVPDGYKSKISSGGPDQGTFCSMFAKDDCKGNAFPFTFPGVMNLARYGFGDKATSYRCDFLSGFDGAH
ncbi:hypothetical protein DM02DRAFT_632495 [Periconia macrospinosa]|uniref:Uncharacterized protein n=1 Tax=Periconia macrospinosa TaxID=97972 RepID=A0A2V1DCH6_9PLEO|nr:hypothetical protein DM02DRAFT_632495 [Periconia macrospinosa]